MQADISFPGFPFDLALLHAHQSLPCSKWRIPHTLDYLVQLTNSPQRKHFYLQVPGAELRHFVVASMTVIKCFMTVK